MPNCSATAHPSLLSSVPSSQHTCARQFINRLLIPMGFRPCCFRVSDLGFALRHVSCSAEFKGALERALRALTPSSASLRTGTLSISQSSQSVSDFKLPFTPSKLCLPPKDARYPRARAVLKRMCLFPHRVRLLIASGGLCLGRACSTLLCAQPVAGCSCFTMSLAVRQMHRRVSNAARWPRRWQVTPPRRPGLELLPDDR